MAIARAFQPVHRATLRERIGIARGMLRDCQLCEHRCGIDRTAGAFAPCGLDGESWCFKRHISYAEEIDLLPSYMVYLGACNFRCRFCVQGPGCFAPKIGVRMDPVEAAADFRRVVARGARTINLLGGEPSLHLHTILEIALAAADSGPPLPLVLNSNMYMTPEVLELLEGVVSVYLADFKFGPGPCARRIARIERYHEVVTRNLLLAAAQPGATVLVRHLLMPGHTGCCFRPVADWMAEHLPGAGFNLMTSYVPAWRTGREDGPDELGRCVTEDERRHAQAYADRLALVRSA